MQLVIQHSACSITFWIPIKEYTGHTPLTITPSIHLEKGLQQLISALLMKEHIRQSSTAPVRDCLTVIITLLYFFSQTLKEIEYIEQEENQMH